MKTKSRLLGGCIAGVILLSGCGRQEAEAPSSRASGTTAGVVEQSPSAEHTSPSSTQGQEAGTPSSGGSGTTAGVAEQSPPASDTHTNPTEGQAWVVPGLGMEFVHVAPGTFRMGSENGKPDEAPIRNIRISRPFWLGRHEVTQAQFTAVMVWNPSRFKGPDNPVEMVSGLDAQQFCSLLTERERLAHRLPEGYEYRLPTEAEWEYAARGGQETKGMAYAGSESAADVAWYLANSGDRSLGGTQQNSGALAGIRRNPGALDRNSNRTHAVGGKKANELGIHDMAGNVAEWCLGFYREDFYAHCADTDPLLGGEPGVARGGGCLDPESELRSASRQGLERGTRHGALGFRVCLAPQVGGTDGIASAAAVLVAAWANQARVPAVLAPPVEGEAWTIPGFGMEFVHVAPGSFQTVPDTETMSRKTPAQEIRLARGFWIGKYEVTQVQYVAVARELPSKSADPTIAAFQSAARGPGVAAFQIPCYDADAFCEYMTARERAAGRLPEGYTYRLPTEAEWEWAAIGGTASKGFPYAGSDNVGEVAWHAGNFRTALSDDGGIGILLRPGTKKPNELGIHDMSGNVGEWCLDWYGATDSNARAVGVDPLNRDASSRRRVVRGGSIFYGASEGQLRTRSRSASDWESGGLYTGFRVCLGRETALPGPLEHVGPPLVAAAVGPANSTPVLGETWAVPGLGMEFVHVAPGTFRMGSDRGQMPERPEHDVTISRPFWMAKCELTRADYRTVTGKSCGSPRVAHNPVGLQWDEARVFCMRLTAREMVAGRLPEGYEYRLPTEAEWEYAARGGQKSKGFRYSGSNGLDEVAWWQGNSDGRTHPVGQKRPNELGIHDMSGNAGEWCLDGYGEVYYASSPSMDPANMEDAPRCVRGGDWSDSEGWVSPTFRRCGGRGNGENEPVPVGVRVCLAPRLGIE